MTTTDFLNSVVKDAMGLFEYYRTGPVAMHKLQPGFIFQRCIDAVLANRQIEQIEAGLGDHCIPELGLAIQLKTTVQEKVGDQFIFCRSSVRHDDPTEQKLLRIEDVKDRILDVFGESHTFRLVLIAVNLTTKAHDLYLLHDGQDVVGDWLKPENVTSPPKQTHFVVRTSKLVKLAD